MSSAESLKPQGVSRGHSLPGGNTVVGSRFEVQGSSAPLPFAFPPFSSTPLPLFP